MNGNRALRLRRIEAAMQPPPDDPRRREFEAVQRAASDSGVADRMYRAVYARQAGEVDLADRLDAETDEQIIRELNCN